MWYKKVHFLSTGTMSFSVHTFETNPREGVVRGFAFHENISEGQEMYFLAEFDEAAIDPQHLAETLFGVIVDHYRTSRMSDPYDRFEDALKTANFEAKKMRNQLVSTPKILVACFDFHHLYLTQTGTSEAYLVRDGAVSQITEGSEESNDLFLNILSGQVSVGDTLVFATDRIFRAMTASQLGGIFARPNFSEAVAMLRHELSVKSEEDFVVTVLGVGKEETPTAGFFSRIVKKKAPVASPSVAEEAMQPDAIDEDFRDDGYTAEEDGYEADQPPHTPGFVSESTEGRFGALKEKATSRQNLILIALTIFLVFSAGITLKYFSGHETEESVELKEKVSVAREALSMADSLLLQGDRKEAATYLTTAEEAVQEVLRSDSKILRSDAQFLLAEVQDKKLQVENAQAVTTNRVADLGVKNENVDAQGLLVVQGNVFAYGPKQVYETVRNIVKSGIPLTEQGTVVAGSARTDQNTLVFLTDDPRIVEYREGVVTGMRTEDESWKNGVDVDTYGRFIYILDPVENQIWKYERRRTNYSAATPYSEGADLSRAVSLAIDGSVYVLGDDGVIQKLFRGAKTEYEFRDIPTSTPLQGKNLKLYTSVDLQYLYVLDPDNERILIFNKGERFATYTKQVLFNLEDARGFWVDDTGQKATILTKSEIYEVQL